MAVPRCFACGVLLVCVLGLTHSQTRAQIDFPIHQYMIRERQFSTTCTVQRNSVPRAELVLFQRGSLVVNSSSGVSISSHNDATHLTITMSVVSATRSDAGELKCIAVKSFQDLSPLAVQSSTIHFSVVPFKITGYPGEILVELETSYSLQCTVQVDPEFLLEGVQVWIRFFTSTGDTAREYTGNYHIDVQQRTVTYSHSISYITEIHLGIYECVAETISSHGILPSYTEYRRSVMVRASPQPESSGGKDSNLLTLLLVAFSVITVILLMLFVLVVFAVVWTKKHKLRNYPISPYPCNKAPGGSTKSNYYTESPEVSSINKFSPISVHHITPKFGKLQSTSSAETDI